MPQKKNKKSVRNSYFYFMLSYRDELIKEGAKYIPSMNELSAICDPLWKAMTPEQKKAYDPKLHEDLAKEVKVVKYNSFGISYDVLDREKQEKENQFQAMIHEIKETVNQLDKESLKTQPFYFVHTNYYCVTQSGEFVPAELAICEFSFENGVRHFYHTLINPLKIPLGYMSSAIQHSEETHGIPMPSELVGGESDNSVILSQIQDFLKDNHFPEFKFKYPPLYTLNKYLPEVKDILSTVNKMGQPESDIEEENFRIFSLEKLFFQLRNATAKEGEEFPSEGISELEFEKDIYSFASGIACGFHEGNDSIPYCSLSCVRRWGFLIADFSCKDLDIPLIPGIHCPFQADTNRQIQSTHQIVTKQHDSFDSSSDPMMDKIICPSCLNLLISYSSICEKCMRCLKANYAQRVIGKDCIDCGVKISSGIIKSNQLNNFRKQTVTCVYCQKSVARRGFEI